MLFSILMLSSSWEMHKQGSKSQTPLMSPFSGVPLQTQIYPLLPSGFSVLSVCNPYIEHICLLAHFSQCSEGTSRIRTMSFLCMRCAAQSLVKKISLIWTKACLSYIKEIILNRGINRKLSCNSLSLSAIQNVLVLVWFFPQSPVNCC